MVKYNTPDWQISAFDKDNNSCVKTKPFGKRIKELEVTYAKVEDIDDFGSKVFASSLGVTSGLDLVDMAKAFLRIGLLKFKQPSYH